MIRKLLTILMAFSCVALAAQEIPNAMIVHRTNGTSALFPMADIDSICFPSMMNVYLRSGSVYYFELTDIEQMDFAKAEDSELYEAVDLGLSVKWAAYNIGANNPEDYGGLYAWGETNEKSNYAENQYSYFSNSQYEYIGVNICGTRYDVARQQWGGQWRMPTRNEIAELTSRCTWVAETRNEVQGYRVTGSNGNSIFLPAAGYQTGTTRLHAGTEGFYWSGTLNRDMPSAAYNINFRGYDTEWSASRSYGFSVRAVTQ